MIYLGFLAFQSGLDLNFDSMTYGLLRSHAKDRSGSAYLNRFTPRDKDTAGGLN